MGIDFSAYLDLSSPPKHIKPLDKSKYKTKKTGGVKFDSDHALITWLSCTAHVADHEKITQLPCTGHMTDHALIT